MVALSVILPVRNGGTYLDAAIASIRAQRFSDFELLVIDDGSTDGSDVVAARHAAEDGRVRILANTGNGLVPALNYGAAKAEAALLARMDADDIAMPARFEQQMSFLRDNPSIGVIGTAWTRIDEAGRALGTTAPPTEPDTLAQRLLVGNPIGHPTAIMRRTVFEKAGGYRPAYVRAEDYDLWLRIAPFSQLANLAEPLLRYRVPAGLDPQLFARQVRSEMAARATAQLRARGAPDPSDYWTEIGDADLSAIGVDAHQVARETARRALHMARQMRKLGNQADMGAALALADAQSKSGLAERTRYLARRAKVFI